MPDLTEIAQAAVETLLQGRFFPFGSVHSTYIEVITKAMRDYHKQEVGPLVEAGKRLLVFMATVPDITEEIDDLWTETVAFAEDALAPYKKDKTEEEDDKDLAGFYDS